MEEYKASSTFVKKKAQAVGAFKASQEYHDSHIVFSRKIYHGAHKEGRIDCRKLIEEEHRETGSVKWHIYNTYLKASYVCPSVARPLIADWSVQLLLDMGYPVYTSHPHSGTRCWREDLDQGTTCSKPLTRNGLY